MKKAFFTFCLILVILAAMILAANVKSGTAKEGLIVPLGLMGTLQGIQSTVSEVPGTFIMEGHGLVMLSWPVDEGYGFVMFSKEGKPILDLLGEIGWTGQKIATVTMAELYNWMFEKGWCPVPASFLPGIFVASVRAYSITMIASGASTLPTMLVIPAGMFNLPPQG